MSKVVVSMFLSLDGLVVGPKEEMDWVINNFDIEGMGADMSKLQASAGTFLLGRQTYQIMAGAWPNQTEETSPGADVMNNTPKAGRFEHSQGDSMGRVRERHPTSRRRLATDSQAQGKAWERISSRSEARNLCRTWLKPVSLTCSISGYIPRYSEMANHSSAEKNASTSGWSRVRRTRTESSGSTTNPSPLRKGRSRLAFVTGCL